MVAETSEASKDKQSESDTGEKNTCKCTCIFLAISAAGENNTCTCKIYNLISAGKATLSVKNVLLCYKSNGQCLVCVHAIRDAIV